MISDRPGTSIVFKAAATERIAPSLGATVAVPITHDWGPLGSERDGSPTLTSLAAFDVLYGNSDTAGRRAVLMALNGQGPDQGGGAGAVVVHRMAPGAARSTRTHANTTPTTPGNAVRFDALWLGTRGNRITYDVADDPRDTTKDQLTLYFDGARVERYSYPNADIAALVAQINDRSNYIAATLLLDGVSLAYGTNLALTGGTDGTALTGTDYTAALTALEAQRFTILAFPNLTDAAIVASAVAWVQTQSDVHRPVMLVIGGGPTDDIVSALARTRAADDPHVVNLGVGSYVDELLDRTVSTAELAPRIAGILAARGEERSLTFAKIGGLYAVGDTAPDSGEIVEAIAGGVTVLSRSTSPDAELKVEKGVTTWVTETDASRPRDIFGDPRLVRIMDLFVRGIKEWGDDTIIGGTTVTDDTRSTVQGEAKARQDNLEGRGLILPGTAFVVVKEPATPEGDDIPFDFGWQFARTTHNLNGTGSVG